MNPFVFAVLVTKIKFISNVADKAYFIKFCNSKNVIYLIICGKFKNEYIGWTVDFKFRFRVHKSDINTKKKRCGTSSHYN